MDDQLRQGELRRYTALIAGFPGRRRREALVDMALVVGLWGILFLVFILLLP